MANPNPFTQLFAVAKRGSEKISGETQERHLITYYYTEDGEPTAHEFKLSDIEQHRYLASVFLVTTTRLRFTNPEVVPCVLLKDFEKEHKGALLACDTIEDALLERLANAYNDDDVIILGGQGGRKLAGVAYTDTLESDLLRYLFASYFRTATLNGRTSSTASERVSWTERCRKLILNMFVSALNEIETGEAIMFANLSGRSHREVELLLAQLFEISCQQESQLATEFWTSVASELQAVGSSELDTAGETVGKSPVFRLFREVFQTLTVRTQSSLRGEAAFGELSRCIEQFNVLLSSPQLAAACIRFQTPFVYYTFYQHEVSELADSNAQLRSSRRVQKLTAAVNTDKKFAKFYELQTAFGAFLSQSCLPSSEYGPFQYFDRPTQVPVSEHTATEQQIWTQTRNNHDFLYELFRLALAKRAGDTRTALLHWIRSALQANADKAKLWSTMPFGMRTPLHNPMFPSDAFFINLSAILLRFTEPMFEDNQNLIDLSFVARNMEKEQLFDGFTCLLPVADDTDRAFIASLKRRHEEATRSAKDSERASLRKSHLYTELFFYAHISVHLGIRSLSDKFMQLNRHLHELEVRFRQQHGDVGLLEELESITSTYLSEKAVLTEPRMLSLAVKLSMSTAMHVTAFSRFQQSQSEEVNAQAYDELVQLRSITNADFENESRSLLRRDNVTKRRCLMLVPEMLVENVLETCKLANRVSDDVFAEFERDRLGHLVEFGSLMMSSLSFCSNPHLRASLAELLATMLPASAYNSSSQFSGSFTLANALKDRVFAECPLVRQWLMRSLLTVFVSIELTSENVSFYQKFNYRHPMYAALRHIWRLHTSADASDDEQVRALPDEQRAVVESSPNAYVRALNYLAFEAIRDVHQPDAPLALRFANCLLNDSNYLLDEALGALARIRVSERLLEEQRSGVAPAQPSPPLPDEQPAAGNPQGGNAPRQNPAGRIEQQTNVAQLTQQARAYNQLGRETIACLAMLSEAAGMRIFMLQPILRDRVISMLNYFLAHLVGKRRRELAVKNKDAVDFNPRELVSSIAQIYTHLGFNALSTNEADASNASLNDTFCSAVSQDAQSYSQDLLEEALKVLRLIEMTDSSRVRAFDQITRRVRELAEARKQEETAFDDAPEEFVDPILGTLMVDPVVLPSSRVTVDRNTIARHLLSDQTDPFNRQPLTMEQCIPDDALRRNIEEWLKKQRSKSSN